MNNDIPADTPGQALDNMTDGRDDPNRGPLDRAENVVEGRDDPNRGPLDRAANAISGEPGGVTAAASGSSTDDYTRQSAGNVVSAVFDSEDEARSAITDLRTAGVADAAMSLITQNRGTTTTSNADGEVVDEDHASYLRGILGGGALGAGLGVAALAIPGVGPLVAAGAIAASAVPGAMAIGAAAGATLGTLNEALKDHGVSDEDVAYYGDHMSNGGVLVTARPNGATVSASEIQDILYRNGGHNSARSRGA